ncbi:MAG: hypothetical protein ACK4RF_00200 [Cyclobacteriaceae bacterium]
MKARFLITILFSVCMIRQAEAQTDSVGYYALYLKKRNGGTEKWVDPGDKIRVMTFQQKEFSAWNNVKSISQQEILFDNGENIRLDDLSKVIKKNGTGASIVGAAILGVGIGALVSLGSGTQSFDLYEELALTSVVLTTASIAILTPPVFRKKKKDKIQIERLYRH